MSFSSCWVSVRFLLGKLLCFFPALLLLLLSLSSPILQYNMHDQINNSPQFSVSCINANSLNMSSLNKPAQLQKIYGILKLKTDIFLLSDIRLSNKNNVNSANELSKTLLNTPYGNFSCIFHSTKNKRGVGILINNTLTFVEEARRQDEDENFVLVRLDIEGKKYIIGAIYGPNDHDPNFFNNLRTSILSLGNFPVLLGGDFNCTLSNLPVDVNPDCLSMNSLPNIRHSNYLNEMCVNLSLHDPFRFLYPNKNEYTYLPRSRFARNRSRIDFFLVSESLLEFCNDCIIADNLQSNQFDHKAVLLKFFPRKRKNFKANISNRIVDDPDISILTDLVIKEVFLIYQDRDRADKERRLRLIGTARKLLRDAGPCDKYYDIPVPSLAPVQQLNRVPDPHPDLRPAPPPDPLPDLPPDPRPEPHPDPRPDPQPVLINDNLLFQPRLQDPQLALDPLHNPQPVLLNVNQNLPFQLRIPDPGYLPFPDPQPNPPPGLFNNNLYFQPPIQVPQPDPHPDPPNGNHYVPFQPRIPDPGLRPAPDPHPDPHPVPQRAPQLNQPHNNAPIQPRILDPEPINIIPDPHPDPQPDLINNIFPFQPRTELIARVKDMINDPLLTEIPEHEINIGSCLFFDMLINNLRNELLSYQSYVFSLMSKYKRKISDELAALKTNHSINLDEIQFRENILKRISEDAIRVSLETHPVFEHLHAEKMSPIFLKLAKGFNKNVSLNCVVDNNNLPFRCNTEREEFIVQYFENIYKLPDDHPDTFEGCIEAFLGPQICNNPIILGSKLTQQEAERLNSHLSLAELDEAVQDCKLRTAAGPDGFSNKLIKKLWCFFRLPLYNYARECFSNKTLTENFRTASVRLIPKKGNTTLLKNWRPISLLNCFYKIISRALNSRLKKISDIIMSRAQKGYTSSRHIQEVLMNVAANIAHCNFTGTTGAIVSIDMAKAFDTIYHGYVRECYKFFGVGDFFLDMMDTIGTNRKACIILEDNKLSRHFNLGTGRPQGDCPSPLQFNSGNQILLYRIELDPNIASVFNHMFVPRNIFPVDLDSIPRPFRTESNGETHKAEGLADDASAATLFEYNSLSHLKLILQEFSVISGLKCNFDKTQVMQVGPAVQITNEFLDLGFTYTNEITLLGFKLNNDGIMVDVLFQEVKQKIARLINIWDRYRLSLPGRISVCKTLLISQLSYYSSIVTPNDGLLSEIQSLIDNFALGSLRVSKDRLYLCSSEGGLGLINIKNFIVGLQSAWVKKACLSTRDLWRINLRNLSSGNCYCINPKLVDINAHPILHNIAKSFTFFRDKFSASEGNFRDAFLLNNDIFNRGQNDEGIIDVNFFRTSGVMADEKTIAGLKFSDFFDNNVFKSLQDIRHDLNIEVNLLFYFRIRHALLYFVDRNGWQMDSPATSLNNFFRPPKGETRRIRKFLDKQLCKKELKDFTTVKTFFRLTGLNGIDLCSLGKVFGIWNTFVFPNKIRDFGFKFYNNCVSINTRLSHFVANQSRLCTNCTVDGRIGADEETFLHLFMDCPLTANVQQFILNKYFPALTNDRATRLLFFFSGHVALRRYLSIAHICAVVVQFLIWECKIHKNRFSLASIDNDFRFYLRGILCVSRKLMYEINDINNGVNNNWAELFPRAIE
jgi:exonuclease III